MATESRELILLEEISHIVVAAHDIQEMLDRITCLLAESMEADVCSLYLFSKGRLILKSTRGLNPAAVGMVSMVADEGLTGLVYETAAPVNVDEASDHPRFKHFPEIGEDKVHSYLGVPLIYRRNPVGVLTLQNETVRTFNANEVRLLVTAASQISTVIAHEGLLPSAEEEPSEQWGNETSGYFYRGIGASAGVNVGVAYPISDEMGLQSFSKSPDLPPDEELKRFEQAHAESRKDLEGLRAHVTKELSEEEGAIFQAHLMLIEDRGFIHKVLDRIREGDSAPHAVSEVARDYVEVFSQIDDPYMRERASDIKDIAHRLIGHLGAGGDIDDEPVFEEPTIVLAYELTPSRLVRLLQPNLAGVAQAKGGETSHAAILCRSAGVPLVTAFAEDPPEIEKGTRVIIDGNVGVVHISPPDNVVAEYERFAEDARKIEEEFRSHISEPSETVDGVNITMMGNAALFSDVEKIASGGGEGVGLYRTEFPFLIRSSFPTEDEQADIYSRVIDALESGVATFRTLDVGGDKPLPYLMIPEEDNPQLGWRSIRISLELEDIFRIQVRALLRAAVKGPVRIMFPMVAGIGELRVARSIVEEERAKLQANGIDVPQVPVGSMIEVPSAAFSIERLATISDFFSIGTNDLVQYLLAVDRANPRVGHLYEVFDPTVLDVIGMVTEKCAAKEKPLAVCGEMAGTPLGAAALMAVGVRELSMNPASLPRVRRLVQSVDHSRLKALGPRLRTASGADEVRYLLKGEMRDQGVDRRVFR